MTNINIVIVVSLLVIALAVIAWCVEIVFPGQRGGYGEEKAFKAAEKAEAKSCLAPRHVAEMLVDKILTAHRHELQDKEPRL